jgi:spore coat protein U-like protein
VRRFSSLTIRAAVAVAALLCAAHAEAAQCSVSVSSVNFGTYDVFATSHNDSTGTVTVNCNGGAKNIDISISRGASSTFFPRQMLKGTEQLQYNLYLDAARTAVWGDGSAGTQMGDVRNPVNNQDETLTVFGRIPALQDVSAGSYSDSVTVTVNY